MPNLLGTVASCRMAVPLTDAPWWCRWPERGCRCPPRCHRAIALLARRREVRHEFCEARWLPAAGGPATITSGGRTRVWPAAASCSTRGFTLLDLAQWFLGPPDIVAAVLPRWFWKGPLEDNAFVLLTA